MNSTKRSRSELNDSGGPKKMGRCEEAIFGLDVFPKRLYMHLPSGKDKYQTGCGLVSTIFLFLMMFLYFIFAVVELSNFEADTQLTAQITGVTTTQTTTVTPVEP